MALYEEEWEECEQGLEIERISGDGADDAEEDGIVVDVEHRGR